MTKSNPSTTKLLGGPKTILAIGQNVFDNELKRTKGTKVVKNIFHKSIKGTKKLKPSG